MLSPLRRSPTQCPVSGVRCCGRPRTLPVGGLGIPGGEKVQITAKSIAPSLRLLLARRLQLEAAMNIEPSTQHTAALSSQHTAGQYGTGQYGAAHQAAIQQGSLAPNVSLPGDNQVLDKVVSRCKTPLIEVIQRGFSLYSALPPVAQRSSNGGREKMPPLREFAQEHGLALSTYWRLISTYLLYRRFPEIAHYRHLGVAHLSVILGVEEECQLYFIRMTEICRWSRRVLEQEVKAYHRNWHWGGRGEQNRHTTKLRAMRLAS